MATEMILPLYYFRLWDAKGIIVIFANYVNIEYLGETVAHI